MGGYIAKRWAPELSGLHPTGTVHLKGAVSSPPMQISANAVAVVPIGVVAILPIPGLSQAPGLAAQSAREPLNQAALLASQNKMRLAGFRLQE